MNVVRNIEATCASALPTHSRSSWGPRESFASYSLRSRNLNYLNYSCAINKQRGWDSYFEMNMHYLNYVVC